MKEIKFITKRGMYICTFVLQLICIISPFVIIVLFIQNDYFWDDNMQYWVVWSGLILWIITNSLLLILFYYFYFYIQSTIDSLESKRKDAEEAEQVFFKNISQYTNKFAETLQTGYRGLLDTSQFQKDKSYEHTTKYIRTLEILELINDIDKINTATNINFQQIETWVASMHEYVEKREKIFNSIKSVNAKNIPIVASMMSDIQTLDMQAFLDAGRTFCYGPARTGYSKIPRTSIKTIQDCKDKVSELAQRERILTYTIDLICSKYKFIDLQSIQSEIPAEVYRRANTVKSLIQLQIEIDSLEQKKDSMEIDIRNLDAEQAQKKRYNGELGRTIIRQHSILKDLDSRIERKKQYYQDVSELPIPDVIQKISSMYADIKTIDDKYTEQYLRNKKPAAPKTADVLAEIRKEKRELVRQLKVMQYEYDWLLQQLPDYADSVDDVLEELEQVSAEESGTEFWLTKEEWSKLSDVEKNRLALERYNKCAKKSNRRIGYDYELYCGYYIQQGALLKGRGVKKVWQYGIENGKEDKGRDIIVESDGKIYIAQCKCWKQERPIRENTIMQLYGSAAEYCIAQYGKVEKKPLNRLHSTIVPVLITTTNLSPTAQRFAEYLGIEVCQFKFDKPYPQIKCNIGKDGTKIYHLPFDQQYDTTIIERDKGEFLAFTVDEAENKGFRHAMKHSPIQD